MQVDGKEFLRNVNIEKEKAKLDKKRKNLEESKVDAVKKEPDYFEPEDDAAYLDLAMDEKNHSEPDLNQLHDIRLDNLNNDDNKKKYIILGFALILLFIITIVVVRLISNSQEEEKLNTAAPTQEVKKAEPIKEDEKLNKIETPAEYKKVIEEDEELQKPTTPVVQKVQKKDIILPEPVKEESPVIIESKKTAVKAKDLFGLDSTVSETKKEVQKKVIKPVEKKVVKPKPVVSDKPKRKVVVVPPKETNFVKKKTATKVDGYYIQVGSFSKKPTDRYLNNIEKKGYRYTVHRMNIKGKYYNKVLIGPYPTRNIAKKSLSNVRNAFNVPGAYILKF